MGARDGLAHSNTAFLERNASWRGVCVEGSPPDFAKLPGNRPACVAVHGVAAKGRGFVSFFHPEGAGSGLAGMRDGHHDFGRLEWETSEAGGRLANSTVYGAPLHTIVTVTTGLRRLSLLSIDVEGAELDVLTAFDFSQVCGAPIHT